MGRIKRSNTILIGNKPRRLPTSQEKVLLHLVGAGFSAVGDLIKEYADEEQIDIVIIEKIVKRAIKDGILYIFDDE